MATQARRTRGRPKQEEVVEIEGVVLEAALQEFIAHGYGGASITRLVRNARISKTTVYSRFASKEELFRAIMDRQIERLAAAGALRTSNGRLDLEAGLTAYGDRTLQISLEGDLLQVNRLIYSESHRFPELGRAAAERTELGIRQIADFVADCAETDGIPCRSPRDVAETFIFALRGWYAAVMLTNRSVAPAERRRWVERVVHTLVSGREDW